MEKPLVTVICLSYNHEQFLVEAVNSVLNQTYGNLQIILTDDASSDQSPELIKGFAARSEKIEVILLKKNIGNCSAFNVAFEKARGEFIIDFATDDVMLPDRIAKQVEQFSILGESYGVVFSDAIYINENGKERYRHFANLKKKGLLKMVPHGDLYGTLLSTYVIPSPTMMVRKKVLDELGGYDQNLSYEDFDFWIRSSRNYYYGYLDEVTTKIRLSKRSMSRGWYKQGDRQLRSTYEVCKKAIDLNRSEEDEQALVKRLKYEVRQSVFSQNHAEARNFFDLLKSLKADNVLYHSLMFLNMLRLPLAPLRNFYHRLRYGRR
jgi:glycosyltransferase involved in cell wall biosynthesis